MSDQAAKDETHLSKAEEEVDPVVPADKSQASGKLTMAEEIKFGHVGLPASLCSFNITTSTFHLGL